MKKHIITIFKNKAAVTDSSVRHKPVSTHTISELIRLLKMMQAMRTSHCLTASSGICCNLAWPYDLHWLMQDWPGHSGDALWPIPDQQIAPKDKYMAAVDAASMWDTNTAYGMLRYDLLIHCICKLERLLALMDTLQEDESVELPWGF